MAIIKCIQIYWNNKVKNVHVSGVLAHSKGKYVKKHGLFVLHLLVFQNKLHVLVGKGHQVGADQSHDGVQDRGLDQVHVPNPPEQPCDNTVESFKQHYTYNTVCLATAHQFR